MQHAFDKSGNPTKAAQGFAKSQGVSVDELKKIPSDKGDRLGLEKKIQGRPATEVLAELLPAMVEKLHFPKNMRWGSMQFRFARPIHWFLALFNGQVIPFELAGIKSGSTTRGHRFLSPSQTTVNGVDDYLAKLKKAFVLADRRERIGRGAPPGGRGFGPGGRQAGSGRGPDPGKHRPGGIRGRLHRRL